MLIDVSSTLEILLTVAIDDKVDDEAEDNSGVEESARISIKFRSELAFRLILVGCQLLEVYL